MGWKQQLDEAMALVRELIAALREHTEELKRFTAKDKC